MQNKMKTQFLSKSINEGFARMVACAFAAQLDPTTEDIADIKISISEAVTNAIIHAYNSDESMEVMMEGRIDENYVEFTIADFGKGIEDVQKAMEPLYTTMPDSERSGMGFTVMESFMDHVMVESVPGNGTKVTLGKYITPLEEI